MILYIDTAVNKCTTALFWDGKCINSITNQDAFKASEVLHLQIEKLLKQQQVALEDLKAIALNGGPGSYTGLRIGASAAKGLCYALDIPLIALNGLELMAVSAKQEFNNEFDYYVPMIDARRMEVFTATYDKDLNLVHEAKPVILNDNYLSDLTNSKILLIGNGSGKANAHIFRKNAIFAPECEIITDYLGSFLWLKWENKDLTNYYTYSPNYLKNFYTTSKLS